MLSQAKPMLLLCSLLALFCSPITQAASAIDDPFIEQKRQQDHLRINSSIEALLQALQRIGVEKQQQVMTEAVQGQIQQWQQLAQQLADEGLWDQARQLLDQSMVEVKTAISTLRNNETLVRSLDFASPAEEYKYEAGRYQTFEMLLQVLVLPKQNLDPELRQQIEQWQQQALQFQQQASNSAAGEQFEQALEQLGQAEALLMKAIRRGGIYLPGMISQSN